METGKIGDFSSALMNITDDLDQHVCQQVLESLHALGCHQPELVLNACHDYLLCRNSLAHGRRAIILHSMELIVCDNIYQIDLPLAQKLISMASEEMTKSKELIPEWQEAASNLLVALGCRFVKEVVQLIMQSFHPEIIPHVYLVKTLGNLSVANEQGMVPLLKNILQSTIPLLVLVKNDYVKSVFTSTFGLFCKSIFEYLENVEKVPGITVTKYTFTEEINIIYNILFNMWLQKKESKLNITIVEALGYIIPLMTKERLEEELPKLIPGILSLYKKHSEQFYITHGLCHVLNAAMEMGSSVLKTQLDNLLHNLHQQICVPVNNNNHLAAKNHNEILCCFTVLARTYSDSLIEFILRKLENNNHLIRIGTLAVLKHLINSVSLQLESKKAQILAGMKLTLLDSNNNVKKTISQVICAMAHQGYLDLEGGKTMVEFIIQQCALLSDSQSTPTCNPDPDKVTDEDLGRTCEVMMSIITTTVKMEDVLWPFLLEFVTMIQYTKALAPVCRCLAYLGKRKQQSASESFFLNYDDNPNLPKPHALLTRLLVVSSCPYQGGGRGAPALRLLQVLSLNIHPATVKVWEEELAPLAHYLVENVEVTLPQQEWEEKLLLLLSRTLKTIDDEGWTCQLSEEMSKQIYSYYSYPQEKGFLYKCLGIVLRQASSKNIKKELQQMLLTVQHNEGFEREGVAVGVGFCAMNHFDDTLSSLEEFSNLDNIFKKTKTFFNIPKDKPDIDVDKVKSTLVLCYGYMTLYAPEHLVLSRIETHILPVVINQFGANGQMLKICYKDLTLILSLVKTVTLIARAILFNSERSTFNLPKKRELLSFVQGLIKSDSTEQLKTPLRQSAMDACMHLVQLNPPISEADTSDLIKTCLKSVFILVPLELDKCKEDGSADLITRELLYTDTITTLQSLLKQILLLDLSPGGLQAMFNHVEGWITSTKEYERETAMDITSKLLRFYLEELNVRNVVAFHNLGSLIGRLVPRCLDPLLTIQQMAMDCLYILLYIQLCYEGFDLDQKDEQVEHLKTIRQQLDITNKGPVLFKACCEIAEVISKRLPHDQLSNLIFMLLNGLSDQHPSCASVAAIVMDNVIKRRGSGLRDQVSEILKVLQVQMQSICEKAVRLSVIHSIAILASQNMPAVLNCLLTYPLPLNKYTSDIWKSLAEDTSLATSTIKHLLDKLNKQPVLEERQDSPSGDNATRHITFEPLAVTCALREILSKPESAEAVNKLYPQLFSSLIVHLSSCLNVHAYKQSNCKPLPTEPNHPDQVPTAKSKDVCLYSVETLVAMLNVGENEEVVNYMKEKGGWDLIVNPHKYHKGVILLARAMAKYAAPHLMGIVEQLAPSIINIHENQKVTVAAFFGELLKHHVVSHLQMTYLLVSSLLRCLFYTPPVVRLLSIRGLGNVSIGVPHNIDKYGTKLLCAMIAVMDERDDSNDLIMLEVMYCLTKLLQQLEPNTVRPILSKISLGVQNFFESDNEKVRAASYTVFGNLARFGDGHVKTSFLEQVHSSLVSQLVHLNESSDEVVKACKQTLRLVVPLLGSEGMSVNVQKYLVGDTLNYDEFMKDTAKQLVKDFPDMINSYVSGCTCYFKRPQPEIRANAVIFSGLLLQRPPKEYFQPAKRVTCIQHLCCCGIKCRPESPNQVGN